MHRRRGHNFLHTIPLQNHSLTSQAVGLFPSMARTISVARPRPVGTLRRGGVQKLSHATYVFYEATPAPRLIRTLPAPQSKYHSTLVLSRHAAACTPPQLLVVHNRLVLALSPTHCHFTPLLVLQPCCLFFSRVLQPCCSSRPCALGVRLRPSLPID